jgi:flagellar motor switch protein FliN/FliY
MTAEEQISLMADVPLEISVELDHRILSLRSIIAMRRSAGENIDILIGGVVVAFGEIVIIENTMGVRITDFNTER